MTWPPTRSGPDFEEKTPHSVWRPTETHGNCLDADWDGRGDHRPPSGFVWMTKGRARAASTGLGEQEWGWRSGHCPGEGGICSRVFSIFPGDFCISKSRGIAPASPCWVVGISEAAAQRCN